MIFNNPKGAPELACDECGCRWVDRMKGSCYECGAPVSIESQAEFVRALAAFSANREWQGKAGQDQGQPHNAAVGPPR